MTTMIEQWFVSNFLLLIAGFGGAAVYFMSSNESPLARKISSTVIGFIISMTFSPSIFKYLTVVDIEYQCAIVAILALGGRWASETILRVAKKFTSDKFGV